VLALSDDVIQAAISLAGLTGETIDTKKETNLLVAQLQSLRANVADGSPLARAIDEHLFRLAAIPSRRHTEVTANTSQAVAELQKVIVELAKLASFNITARPGPRGDVPRR
jgi:hypothetical protein